MSVLDIQILQNVSTLPEMYKQTVLDLIASLKRTIEQEQTGSLQTETKTERKIGSRKGVKFLADGVKIEDYDDETAELLGDSLCDVIRNENPIFLH